MISCFFVRRRIGAYLDGALEGARAEVAARHLGKCASCRRDAEALRQMRALLRRSLRPPGGPAEPDWTGFWPGVVRGIEAAKHEPGLVGARRGWFSPRWALGGALVAVFLASVTFWQAAQLPAALDGPVSVRAADTEIPQGSVMVYHPPDHSMAVIWVFGLDDAD